jgi:hypothetical protein
VGKMGGVRLIFTPDAKRFIYDEYGFYSHVGDPAVDALRARYEQLWKQVGGSADCAGVVTFDRIFRRFETEMWQKLEEDSLIKPITTYIPLEIMRQALTLKEGDFSSALDREFAYRSASALFMNKDMIDYPGISDKMQEIMLLFFIVPDKINTSSLLREVHGLVQDEQQIPHNLKGLFYRFERACKEYLNMLPNLEDLDIVWSFFQKRYEAYGLSGAIQPHYVWPTMAIPSVYSVNVNHEVKYPDFWNKMIEILRLGARAEGLKDIPEDVMRNAKKAVPDKFGMATFTSSLDKLLDQLPEPKTIITDIYILDHFPQLAQMGFETVEFNPEVHNE